MVQRVIECSVETVCNEHGDHYFAHLIAGIFQEPRSFTPRGIERSEVVSAENEIGFEEDE